MSAVSSPTFCCGESVGCGTTSDEDSDSKETEGPHAKKAKVNVACKRRSKRLENIVQKCVKDSGNGSGSHSSPQIKQSSSQSKQGVSGKRW